MNFIVNRSALLEKLYQQVLGRENVWLYGETGAGKSHLISQLTSKLNQRRICFNFSFRGIQHLEDFAIYYEKVLRKQAKNHPTVGYHLNQYFNEEPANYIKTWEQWIEWHQGLQQAVVRLSQDLLFVLDHFDEWEVKGQAQFPVEAISQLSPAPNCQWLIATENRENPKGFSSFVIPPLELNELEFAEEDAHEAKQTISFTKGNLRILMDMLNLEGSFDQRKENFCRQLHDYFTFIKPRFTALQWNLMRAVALEEVVEQPMAFSFLVKYKLGAASSVDRALNNLTNTNMLQKTERGYALKNVAMQRWFQWLYA